MAIRRVVTAVRDGKAVIASDAQIDIGEFFAVPGFAVAMIWGTQGVPSSSETFAVLPSILPPRGGSRFVIVSFPPDAVFADPRFDSAAAEVEQAARLRDLAAAFEPDAPGMHRTETVDYAIVLAGTPVLELDDGVITTLSAGDTIVQNATRHGWRNPGATSATIAFVMLGDENAPLA